jgi:hypothetical protein
MIILTERKLTYKSDIKDPKEVQAFFDMIWKAFSDIDNAIGVLTTIFIDTRWCLKEGLDDSLSAYRKASEVIRNRLAIISMMNSTLTRFLNNEIRPIPIDVNISFEIDMLTEAIVRQLKFYYKKAKESKIPFPKFDNEIKQHKDIIEVINSNIDRVNEINSSYSRYLVIRRIKNLPSIK